MFKTILFLCFVGFSLGSLLGGWRDYHGKVPESVIAVVKQKYRVEHNIQVTKIKIHNVKTQVVAGTNYSFDACVNDDQAKKCNFEVYVNLSGIAQVTSEQCS